MTTKEVVEGLNIFLKYFDDPDGHHLGAGHDVIYIYKTKKHLSSEDLERLIELGWFQEDVDYMDDEETDGEFAAKHYNPDEGWTCYV